MSSADGENTSSTDSIIDPNTIADSDLDQLNAGLTSDTGTANIVQSDSTSDSSNTLVDSAGATPPDPAILVPLAVVTDKPDYAPGDTAVFTATNVAPGNTVTFEVAHVTAGADGILGTADDLLSSDLTGTGTTWSVTDGGPGDLDGVVNGVIETNWSVNQDAAGQAFQLSATELTNGQTTTAGFTDSNPHTPVLAAPATIPNGLVFLTGATNTSTGTGIFPSFVQIQNTGTEEGFNTDFRPPVLDTDNSPVHNHSLLFSLVPTVTGDGANGTVSGTVYREFRLDLNESDHPITLEQLKLYWDTAGNDSVLPGLSNQIYDMDGGSDGRTGGAPDLDTSVLLTAWSSGSGHSDYKVLIPDSYFSGVSQTDYIYLYSMFSDADLGFEEWSVGPTGGTGGPTPHALLSVAKDTICGTDGDGVAGGIVLAGNAISWTYTVVNIGDTGSSVSGLTLTDDKLGTLYENGTLSDGVTLTGDTNADGKLDYGETWVFKVSGLSIDGPYTNVGTAAGSDTESGDTVSGFDTSGYTGAIAGVTIDKEVSGNGITYVESGANDYTGAPVILAAYVDGTGTHSTNANVYFQAIVTNTTDANLDIAGVAVTDISPVATFIGAATVSVGSPETYTFSTTAVAGSAADNTDTATVNGTVSDDCDNSTPVSASDTARYIGATAGINIEKLISVDGGTNWYFLDDDSTPGEDTIAAISTLTGIAAANLHIGTPSTLVGAQVKYEVVVSNTSTDGLTETVSSLTDSRGLIFTFDHTTLAYGENEVSNAVTTTAVAGSSITNTVNVTGTVSDDFGNTANPTDTDSAAYNGESPTLAGLTKGYWSTHLTLWDVLTTDSSNSDLNPAPGYNWNHSGGITNSALVSTGPASGRGAVNGANNGGGDSGFLLGDLNHDGTVSGDNSSDHLFLDLASAQTLANSSVAGDARIILGSQAVAAQLNEYNDYVYDTAHGGVAAGYDASPTGLIEEAVLWLKGSGPLSNGGSNLNFITANDLTSPSVVAIIDDAAGNDYTLSGGAITFKSAAVSSSSPSWSAFASVFDETSFTAIDGSHYHVTADGEGLKNALAAYNHGLNGAGAGFVISTDGTLIGWQDSLSGPVYDVHANTLNAFWGILEDQNLLWNSSGHTQGMQIIGISHT